MSYPRYPEYEDSGVEWLGEVPRHWEVRQSRRLFALRNERARAGDEMLTASQRYGVIPQKRFMELEGQSVVQVVKGADILKHADAGDFVISMRSFEGGIEYSSFAGAVSSAYVVLKPGPTVYAPFFAYLLKSAPYVAALQATSNLVRDGQALRYDNFARVPLPNVPVAEQLGIARFLDEQFALLDGLINDQSRLVQVLNEKLQAVISHAVTKGLNPNARMKPSGIEWLGNVPTDWEVVRLKYLANIQTGSRNTEDAVPEGAYPLFVRSDNVERADSYSFDCEAILTAGDGAGVAKVFHYYDGKFDAHQRVYVLNNFRRVAGKFLFHYFKQNFYKVALEGSAKSTVDSLRYYMLADFHVCVPPPEQQAAIVEYVEEVQAKVVAAERAAAKSMKLLIERRTALISAAVTGKIDVRNAPLGMAGHASPALT